jgi:molecular chaperone GrpE
MENEKTIQKEATTAATAPAAESASDRKESPLTADQLKELQTQAAKAGEYWDRLLRQAAEFDNFKKRAARERLDAIKYANQALLDKIVPVLDHFEAALAAAGSAQENTLESFKTGMAMIQNQLKAVLVESGLEEIDAVNKPFDPNFHEAVSQMESAEVPEGHVLQQLRKGYKIKERLLRPATVVVAKKPAA